MKITISKGIQSQGNIAGDHIFLQLGLEVAGVIGLAVVRAAARTQASETTVEPPIMTQKEDRA